MKPYILALSGLVWLTANVAVAEVSDDFETIVVTAHRTSTTELLTPYSIETIDQNTLAQRNYRSSIDIFRDMSGVLLQKTAHGQGSPFVRGFTGFRNLMLIDGVRLNNAVFRSGPNQYWATVDGFSVERLELVKGAGSVLYGSDSIGGTVNILTKTPDIGQRSQAADSSLLYRVAEGENSHILRLESDIETGSESGLMVGLTHKDFGDFSAGSGELPQTGYDEFNADIKYVQRWGKDARLTLAHFLTDQKDVPRTHKTLYAVPFAGSSVGSELRRDLDQKRQLSYAKYEQTTDLDWLDQWQATVSYHQQQERRDRLRTRNRSDNQGLSVDTLGMNLVLESQTESVHYVYGLDYYRDDVDSFSSRNPVQGPVADDAQYQWLGGFVDSRIRLAEDLMVSAGARYSRTSMEAGRVSDPITAEPISLSGDWNAWVGNLRVLWTLEPMRLSAFAGISQGFRAPNLSDLTRFDSARSNEFEIPAPGLEPENYVSTETGLRYRRDAFSYDVAAYYTDIRDQIIRFPTGNQNDEGNVEISKANSSDGYVYGLEADINWRLNDSLRLFAMLSWQDGRIDTFPTSEQVVKEDYISRLMPLTGQFGLNQTISDRWWWEAQWLFAERADRLSARDKGDTQRIPPGGTPGYGVVHIRSGYALSDSVQLNFALENVFDKDYRVHGSGQNEVGRNLVASLNWHF